jgi:hypothetical protein
VFDFLNKAASDSSVRNAETSRVRGGVEAIIYLQSIKTWTKFERFKTGGKNKVQNANLISDFCARILRHRKIIIFSTPPGRGAGCWLTASRAGTYNLPKHNLFESCQ